MVRMCSLRIPLSRARSGIVSRIVSSKAACDSRQTLTSHLTYSPHTGKELALLLRVSNEGPRPFHPPALAAPRRRVLPTGRAFREHKGRLLVRPFPLLDSVSSALLDSPIQF